MQPDVTFWQQALEQEQVRIAGERPGCVETSGYKVFSQSDEDGMIEEIFRRIGTTDRRFVEFGVEFGQENNTRLLLETGWSGLWIEGHPPFANHLFVDFEDRIAAGRLKVVKTYVTAENINNIIAGAGITGEIDLLSIDIDSNDFHVWRAIGIVAPRVVVIEHNNFPPPWDWVMPYDPFYRWDHKSGKYGSSLTANVRLAREKGYTLIATGVCSPNGFYVRDDLIADRFPGPHTAEAMWRPLNYDMILNFPRRAAPSSAARVDPAPGDEVERAARR